jgi:UrcA family protein
MRSPLFRLFLLSCLFGTFSLNVAVADEPASRQTNSGSVAVSFDDLNLANPAGRDSFMERIEYAAHKVCGVDNFKVSLDIERVNRECVEQSIDKATGKINDTNLTASHQPSLVEGIIGS